jgi:CHAT domain-containing protein
MIGLARGLLSAGARSLLLSLWDVNDKSTAEFMKVFYSNFVHHQNAALALQNAMQETRRLHAHPYYWAPFTLMGGISF